MALLATACTNRLAVPSATPLADCDMIGPETTSAGLCPALPATLSTARLETTDSLLSTGDADMLNPDSSAAVVAETSMPLKPTVPAGAIDGLVPTVTPCPSGPCTYQGTLFFARPIAPPANDQVDTSYRFGSTQGKQRDPHHGVEFLNPYGTPVLAAADGVVVVAGDDKQTLYSPYLNYYGNLVVVQHDLPAELIHNNPAFPTPVYTLYAHLSEVLVETGQVVRQGQEIGKVGMSGGATGSHLHFEVRLGVNSYAASRNPELWLKPSLDESGQQTGALAVRVTDERGQPLAVQDIVIQHMPDGPAGAPGKEIYLQSYEEKSLLGQPPWQESFGVGTLPAGWYRINFPYFGLQRQDVQVFPGQVTVFVFQF